MMATDPLSEAREALQEITKAPRLIEALLAARDALKRLNELPAPVRMVRVSRDMWVPAAAGGKAWLYPDEPAKAAS